MSAPDHWLVVLLGAIPALALLVALAMLPLLPRPRPTRRVWLLGALLVAVPILLQQALPHPRPIVYFDEFVHADLTRSLARQRVAALCTATLPGRCIRGGGLTRWPLATHVVAAFAVPLFDSDSPRSGMRARMLTNQVASVATPLLVFLWVGGLVGSELGAVLAALVVATFPALPILGASAALEPGALALCLLTLLCAERYRAARCWQRGLLLGAALVLTLHARLELCLVLPWVLWRAPARRWLALAGGLALVPLVWLVARGVADGTPGWNDALAEHWQLLVRQLPDNLHFWVDPALASPVVLPLALAALVLPAGRRLWPLAATAGGLLLAYSAHQTASFLPEHAVNGWRFSPFVLIFVLPLFAVAAKRLRDFGRGRRAPALAAVAAIVLLLPLPSAYRFVRSVHHPLAPVDRLLATAVGRRAAAGARDVLVVTDPGAAAYAAAVTGGDVVDPTLLLAGVAPLRPGRTFYLRVFRERPPGRAEGLCERPLPGAVVPGSGVVLFEVTAAPCE